MAPPPVDVKDWLLRKLTPFTVSCERLRMAPPPWRSPGGFEPLLSVRLLRLRLAPSSTMKNRKFGAPLVGRVIVAPLPMTVTSPTMSGRALGPSIELSTAVMVYVHAGASETVPPPTCPLAAEMAVRRSAVAHAMGAAPTVCGAATTPNVTSPAAAVRLIVMRLRAPEALHETQAQRSAGNIRRATPREEARPGLSRH